MDGVYEWNVSKSFEYNYAAGSVPAFMDDLLALRDPLAFRQKLADEGWGANWCDAPGVAMLAQGPQHELIQEAVLRAQFRPIGNYIDGLVLPTNRYQHFCRFVADRCLELNLGPWAHASADGTRSWEAVDILPGPLAGERMFTLWLDHRHSNGGIVRRILNETVRVQAA